MIYSSSRVPGLLLPIGARYWGNTGAPLDAMKQFAGLGEILTSEEAAARIMQEGSQPTPVTMSVKASRAPTSRYFGLALLAVAAVGLVIVAREA